MRFELKTGKEFSNLWNIFSYFNAPGLPILASQVFLRKFPENETWTGKINIYNLIKIILFSEINFNHFWIGIEQ